jgi:hypothetical protein
MTGITAELIARFIITLLLIGLLGYQVVTMGSPTDTVIGLLGIVIGYWFGKESAGATVARALQK